MSNDLEEKEESHIWAWILMGLALLYTVSPVDILPDFIPVLGWVDDALAIITGGLNVVRSYLKQTNETGAKIAKYLKWLIIAIIALIIVHLFK